MKRDPLEALEGFYGSQPRMGSESFEKSLRSSLEAECAEIDFEPAVTGLRRTLPIAAAIVFGMLTTRASESDVRQLATQIEQAQASSIPTELETQWDDSTID